MILLEYRKIWMLLTGMIKACFNSRNLISKVKVSRFLSVHPLSLVWATWYTIMAVLRGKRYQSKLDKRFGTSIFRLIVGCHNSSSTVFLFKLFSLQKITLSWAAHNTCPRNLHSSQGITCQISDILFFGIIHHFFQPSVQCLWNWLLSTWTTYWRSLFQFLFYISGFQAQQNLWARGFQTHFHPQCWKPFL